MRVDFVDFLSEPLDLDCFDCGETELNEFLREESSHFVKMGLSAVVLMVEHESRELLGFYAISPTSTDVRRLSQRQRELYNVSFPIPSWLIGRLTISKKHHKKGLGAIMLMDAFKNICTRASKGAGAMVVVDAKNRSVKKFYEKYGFKSFPSCGLKLACTLPNIPIS